jgi:hypothetical protein
MTENRKNKKTPLHPEEQQAKCYCRSTILTG